MLRSLAVKMTIVIFICLIIAILGVGFYVLKSHRRKGNYLGDPKTQLRYFIQKQVDYNDQIVGYECLLRQANSDGSWTLPTQMERLPLQRVVSLLDVAFKSLPRVPIKLSINLSYRQIISADFFYFVRWAVSTIAPMELVIEYNPGNHVDNTMDRKLFLRRVRKTRQLGMLFLLDNFSLSSAELARIEWLLPEVDVVKVSVTEFRQVATQVWSQLNLDTWSQLAKKYHLKIILTEVETETDQRLADQLGVGLRQGYHFGRPENTQGGSNHAQKSE